MEYIYVRTTRIEWVTPEWAEGRAHSVLHVDWVAYPADSRQAQEWLTWVASLPAKLQAAYAAECQRWQETQQMAENARQLVAEFNLRDWNYSE